MNEIVNGLTRYGIGEAIGMALNERVLDVPSTDTVCAEQDERLPPVGWQSHHLLVSHQVQLIEQRRVFLQVLGRIVFLLFIEPHAVCCKQQTFALNCLAALFTALTATGLKFYLKAASAALAASDFQDFETSKRSYAEHMTL